MAFRTFKEWKKIYEGKTRSQGSEADCPYPDDPEFCRKWNLYLAGKGPDPMPEKQKPPRKGPTEGQLDSPSAKNVLRRKQREGEGRHKWRYRGEY